MKKGIRTYRKLSEYKEITYKYVEYAQHNCVKLYRESMRCLYYHLNISWITKILLLLHNKKRTNVAISKHEEKTREKKETKHTGIPIHIVCMYAKKPLYVIIRSGSISITLFTSCILEINHNHNFGLVIYYLA